MSTDNLLAAREHMHGDFAEQTRMTRRLKDVMQTHGGWARLNHMQQAALEMIALKMGRIFAGDPTYADHWADIAGYAELGRRAGENHPLVTSSEDGPRG